MHAFHKQPTNIDTELELHPMQRPRDHHHFSPLKIKVIIIVIMKNSFRGETAAPLGTLATSELMTGVEAV